MTPDANQVPDDLLNPNITEVVTYTPGYVFPKIILVLLSTALLGISIAQLFKPLALITRGHRVEAVVVSIVKSKPGYPDTTLSRDLDWKQDIDRGERGAIYWNKFSFHDVKFGDVIVQSPIGCAGKPAYPILDESGLPTTVTLFYKPDSPQQIVVPGELSTWFAAGALGFFSLIGLVSGMTILYFAKTPIIVPHIADPPAIPPKDSPQPADPTT